MAAGRFNLARTYLKRNHAGDREAAIALLSLALESADRLGIPETKRIRLLLEQALNAS
jgi:hypothetical protein